ncbi:MAG TPA: DUF1348 family protein [Candidatus Sulfotelmatobacter sp.]|nr:DUF1348 family protein [Candidatus Sulfotelmatobacter sp.]
MKRDHCFSFSQVGQGVGLRLIKEMWAFAGNRIAVRFAYEWHDDSDHWYRSYGNENWEFIQTSSFFRPMKQTSGLYLSNHWQVGGANC